MLTDLVYARQSGAIGDEVTNTRFIRTLQGTLRVMFGKTGVVQNNASLLIILEMLKRVLILMWRLANYRRATPSRWEPERRWAVS